MSECSKHRDVNAVLHKARVQLAGIKGGYQQALSLKMVPDELLLVEIKDYLGNLRSALDYSACKLKAGEVYFPVSNSPADFSNKTTDFPVGAIPIMESVQPYKGDSWLSSFSSLSNKHKHVSLIPQKRTEVRETRVTSPSGSRVSWGPGVTFGPSVQVMGVPIDHCTQLPIANDIIKTEVITWVSFRFDNTDFPSIPGSISVLPFLEDSLKRVQCIIKSLES